MLPSRCMPRRPPSLGAIFQAFPSMSLRAPSPAERCKPCPVALVPTLGFSASRSQPLDLLKSTARKYDDGMNLYVDFETVLFSSDTSNYAAKTNTPSQPRPDAFARASTSAYPRGGRSPVYPCLHSCSRTHGEIQGRNGPRRCAPKLPHKSEVDEKNNRHHNINNRFAFDVRIQIINRYVFMTVNTYLAFPPIRYII